MGKLDSKNGWAPKNWCLRTVVLVKTIESSLDCKEVKPANPKGNQWWIFIERTGAEAEAPILWPSDGKSQFTGKDPDTGRDRRQEEEEEMTEDEMVGWHDWLNGHEFQQAPGVGEGQRSLAYCGSWGHKELNVTEQLNNNIKFLPALPCPWIIMFTFHTKAPKVSTDTIPTQGFQSCVSLTLTHSTTNAFFMLSLLQTTCYYPVLPPIFTRPCLHSLYRYLVPNNTT